MLSTADALKNKLAEVIADGFTQVRIAEACGVSKQAVQGWKNTGRIDKRHLTALASLTGKPLEWWLDIPHSGQADTKALGDYQLAGVREVREPRRPYGAPRWPFASVSAQEYAQLTDEQKILVEGFIHGLLAEAGRNKSLKAPHAA